LDAALRAAEAAKVLQQQPSLANNRRVYYVLTTPFKTPALLQLSISPSN